MGGIRVGEVNNSQGYISEATAGNGYRLLSKLLKFGKGISK
jgi:hypothetical protein